MSYNCVNGRIAKVDPEQYLIKLTEDSHCKSCGMAAQCNEKYVELDRSQVEGTFKTGQRVSVEYEQVVQTSFILYLLPILFFFAGIFITGWLFRTESELAAFAGGLVATGLALFIIHIISQKIGNQKYKIHVKPLTQH